ncbi:hypothetical protein ABIE91_002143 [Bradyrhizobium elkanii]|jgi:hypothetical protein
MNQSSEPSAALKMAAGVSVLLALLLMGFFFIAF